MHRRDGNHFNSYSSKKLIWLHLSSKITEIYNEETIEEILKTLKHFMIDNTTPGEFKNASWEEYKDFLRLSEHPNKVIAEHARLLMARLKTDNPWM